MTKQLFWLIVWAVLFGYLEAAIVVYIREVYYPDGFAFPLVIIENHIMYTEVLREAVTLLIMWATVCLAYKRLQSRISAFIILFGVWDIFYYIFLKLLIDWPQSLDTWDILFLIPTAWVGPVWAPVLVSFGFIYAGSAVLIHNHQKRFLQVDRTFILLELLAMCMIILSFIIPGFSVYEQGPPEHFPWYLFFLGFLTAIAVFLYYFYSSFRQ